MAATDERAIHEFPTGTIDDNSLLIMDRPTSTPGEYETEKFAIANLGLKLLGGIDFPSNLDTEEQDIFGAINEVNAKAMNIAAEYDETASYSKGNYCIYQNVTYRCIKASGTTTGTFVAADWTQIKVLSEVNELNEINTYSTTEKAIGKWTDGKTIYRKVLTDNFGNSMSLNIDSGVEIDTLVYISIKVIKGNIVFELPFRNEISASEYYQGYSFVNLQTSGNNALVTIIGTSSNSTYFNNCDIQVIMEYTKRS